MQGEFESKQLASGRAALTQVDLEADWNFLRTHLDHPAHPWRPRLGFGLAEWLSRRMHPAPAPPALSVLARIQLGPRQAVALVEAEGTHLLVGSSADGPLTFFPLDSGQRDKASGAPGPDASPAHSVAGPGGAAPGAGTLGFAPRAPFPAAIRRGSRPAGRAGISGRVSW